MVALAAAVALLVAGCGSSDSTTGETPTISRSEYVKQANAICAAGNKEINEEFEKFAKENGLKQNQPPPEAKLTEAAEDFFIPSIRRQVEEVAALGVPEGAEEQVETFIANAEAEVERAEENPGQLISDNSTMFDEVNKEATELGLTACAEEG